MAFFWRKSAMFNVFCIIVTSCCIVVGLADGSVEGPPVFRNHQPNMSFTISMSATLRCDVSNARSVTWYHNGTVVDDSQVSVNEVDFTLFIVTFRYASAGSYYCVASNDYGSTTGNTIWLRIAFIEDAFQQDPSSQTPQRGDRVVLQCKPPRSYPTPTVIWMRGDTALDLALDRYSIRGDQLVIRSVQELDNGQYRCMATNAKYMDEKSGIKYSKPARITVLVKPTIISLTAPADNTVVNGLEATFNCEVEGDPEPRITWKKSDASSGKTVIQTQLDAARVQIFEENQLRIKQVVPSDAGTYTCEAANGAGSVTSSVVLKVITPPKFRVKPVDVVALVGQTVTLRCKADAIPTPTIFWRRTGQTTSMRTSSRQTVNQYNGDAVITDVGFSDAGEYTCIAANNVASVTAHMTLTIKDKTMVNELPPVIKFGPQNQTRPIGATTTMPCTYVTARTPITVTWTKDNRTLEMNDDRTIGGTGNLKIKALKVSDRGIYLCKASNHFGESIWRGELLVYDRNNPTASFNNMKHPSDLPGAPGTPVAIDVQPDRISLKWDKPAKWSGGGSRASSGYMLQYFCPEEFVGAVVPQWIAIIDAIHQTRYTFKDVKPDRSYYFVVRALNSNGVGAPSPISDLVRTSTDGQRQQLPKQSIQHQLADNLTPAERTMKQELETGKFVHLSALEATGPTKVHVSWKLLSGIPSGVTGYYIKWYSGQGPEAYEKVKGRETTSYLVSNGLKPYTDYIFRVVPFVGRFEGNPSNLRDVKTLEGTPSVGPLNLKVQMMNISSVKVSWTAPPHDKINGVLTGYKLDFYANRSLHFLDKYVDDPAKTIMLMYHLKRDNTDYRFTVAARTARGPGPYAEVSDYRLTKARLLADRIQLDGPVTEIFYHEPWFIAVVGLTVWWIVIVIIVLIWCRYRRKRKAKQMPTMPFIKINDGQLWLDNYARTQTLATGINGSVLLNDLRVNTNDSQNDAPYYAEAAYIARTLNSSNGGQLPGAFYNGQMNHSPAMSDPHHYMQLSQQNLSSIVQYRPYPNDVIHSMHPNVYGPSCSGGDARCESPSPYATTTLVMNGHRQRQMNEAMRQQRAAAGLGGGISPRGQNANLHYQRRPGPAGAGHPDEEPSPPTTEVSYVHSDGSSNGNGSGGAAAPHRMFQPQLIDFIPPPPSHPPPGEPGSIPLEQASPLAQLNAAAQAKSMGNRGGMNRYNSEQRAPHHGVPAPPPRTSASSSTLPPEQFFGHRGSPHPQLGGGYHHQTGEDVVSPLHQLGGAMASNSTPLERKYLAQLKHMRDMRNGQSPSCEPASQHYDYEALNDLLRSFHNPQDPTSLAPTSASDAMMGRSQQQHPLQPPHPMDADAVLGHSSNSPRAFRRVLQDDRPGSRRPLGISTDGGQQPNTNSCENCGVYQANASCSPRSSYVDPPDSKRSSMLASFVATDGEQSERMSPGASVSSICGGGDSSGEDDDDEAVSGESSPFLMGEMDFAQALAKAAGRRGIPVHGSTDPNYLHRELPHGTTPSLSSYDQGRHHRDYRSGKREGANNLTGGDQSWNGEMQLGASSNLNRSVYGGQLGQVQNGGHNLLNGAPVGGTATAKIASVAMTTTDPQNMPKDRNFKSSRRDAV